MHLEYRLYEAFKEEREAGSMLSGIYKQEEKKIVRRQRLIHRIERIKMNIEEL